MQMHPAASYLCIRPIETRQLKIHRAGAYLTSNLAVVDGFHELLHCRNILWVKVFSCCRINRDADLPCLGVYTERCLQSHFLLTRPTLRSQRSDSAIIRAMLQPGCTAMMLCASGQHCPARHDNIQVPADDTQGDRQEAQG